MRVVYPNYKNSLINLMNSIRFYFGLNKTHDSMEDIDKILKESKKSKVIVMLLDGMGSFILDRFLDKDSFLQKHKYKDFISSFPSTTVAATTTVRSTLNPIETGWLGWTGYIKEIDDFIVTFNGNKYYSKGNYNKDIFKKLYPFKNFVSELNENNIKSCEIFPKFNKDVIHARTFNGFLRKTLKANKTNSYIYSYWGQPDTLMHQVGSDNIKVGKLLEYYNDKLEKFYSKLDDNTICFIIADHGHINTYPYYLSNYPDVLKLLKRNISIEGRNASFFVKEDCKVKFVELYEKYFKRDFLLFSKNEVYKMNLFGDGEKNKNIDSLIGDFQMVAIGNRIFAKDYKDNFKSAHAGMSEEEMTIPLIILKK